MDVSMLLVVSLLSLILQKIQRKVESGVIKPKSGGGGKCCAYVMVRVGWRGLCFSNFSKQFKLKRLSCILFFKKSFLNFKDITMI
jgi:hypothetical protein